MELGAGGAGGSTEIFGMGGVINLGEVEKAFEALGMGAAQGIVGL